MTCARLRQPRHGSFAEGGVKREQLHPRRRPGAVGNDGRWRVCLRQRRPSGGRAERADARCAQDASTLASPTERRSSQGLAVAPGLAHEGLADGLPIKWAQIVGCRGSPRVTRSDQTWDLWRRRLRQNLATRISKHGSAIARYRYREATFVNRAMVGSANTDQVLEFRLTALCPVMEMVSINNLMSASRKLTAAIAHGHGSPNRRRNCSRLPTDIQSLAGSIAENRNHAASQRSRRHVSAGTTAPSAVVPDRSPASI